MRRFLLAFISVFLFCVTNVSAQNIEAAAQAVNNMGPGWNLGNTLDAHSGSRMTDVVRS